MLRTSIFSISSVQQIHISSFKRNNLYGQLKLLRCLLYVSWVALSWIDHLVLIKLGSVSSWDFQFNIPADDLVTSDPFFLRLVVCRLLLLPPPETYSFSQFSRRFFVPCLELGALRRCPPFHKMHPATMSDKSKINALEKSKFTPWRNPSVKLEEIHWKLPSSVRMVLSFLKYNAFH